jgi:hypothetical protein
MLQSELASSLHSTAFRLSLPKRDGLVLSELSDPWDYWVVSPELLGAGEGGSGYYFAEATGAFTLRRITDASKVRLRGSYTRNLSGYRLEDGSRIRGDVAGWDGRALYAGSLGENWALGALAVARASEFENLDAHGHAGVLAEYNFFPYEDNASHQLRLAYQAGTWANWYLEENTAGLLSEGRPYHALSLVVDVNHSWGSVQWVTQGNAFIDEPRLYRISTGALLNVRLFEGLAFRLEGQAALVRDQINLRRRPITDEELFLWTAEQATDYTFEAVASISYTLGSVHNTIVNPRFGRVDLVED